MSLADLIDAMYLGDFFNSTRILCELQSEGNLVHIAYALRKKSEDGIKNPLVIRDHILQFFGGFPVYAGLDIDSLDLLETFSYASSQDEARQGFLNMVRTLFTENDARFLPRYIEIEDLADNQFMILVTDLLEKRVKELASVTIPYSVLNVGGRTRERYLISGLGATSYGRKILAGVGVKLDLNVVGRSSWDEISRVLIELGYEPARMIDEVDEATWAELTSIAGYSSAIKSRELKELAALRQIITKMDSSDRSLRLEGLRNYHELRTMAYLERIATTARTGTLEERCLAIDILGEMGSDEHDSLLVSLLNTEEPNIRLRAANAISRISARDFLRETQVSIDRVLRTTSLKDQGMLAQINLQPRNRLERIDAAKFYLNLDTELAETRFRDIYYQLDLSSKHELLGYAFSLKRQRAEILIRRALQDDDTAVREAAINIGRQIWPGSEWDFTDEEKPEL